MIYFHIKEVDHVLPKYESKENVKSGFTKNK